MAAYKITPADIDEISDHFGCFAGQLDDAFNRLIRIRDECPADMPGIRPALDQNIRQVGEAAKNLAAFGRTLCEIANLYAQAEARAFSGTLPGKNENPPPMGLMEAPVFGPVDFLLLIGELIMPDWLQEAVIKYEQSLFDATEGTVP